MYLPIAISWKQKTWFFIYTNLKALHLHLSIICAKFGQNWSCGENEENEKYNVNLLIIVCIYLKNDAHVIINSYIIINNVSINLCWYIFIYTQKYRYTFR